MMRKTKIVCTIGPACDSEETLTRMCRAGMNVARLNFSHGTHEEHQARIDRLKKVREALGLPVAIMLDTKGPEYRIRTFADGKVLLAEGSEFTFTTEETVGDEHHVSVNFKGLMQDLEAAMPGRKLDFYQGFLSRGRPVFARREAEEGLELAPCTECGYPTSSGDRCGVCRIRAALLDEG